MAKKIDAPENLDEELNELEQKLDRLRVLYEQYFLGIEKRPPSNLQRDVVRVIRYVGTYHIQNTTHKFRYSALVQRFNVHLAYWMRTVRQIEEGTYKRHRFKALERSKKRSGERVDAAELAKRALLRKMLGDEAVEKRRERMKAERGEEEERPDFIPAVARKRKRGKKRPQDLIRGKPLAEIEKRNDAFEDKSAEGGASQEQAPNGPDNGGAPTNPESHPTQFETRPPTLPKNTPLTAPMTREAEEISLPRMPTLQRRSDWDGVSNSLEKATNKLSGAGLTESRARRIYNELISARRLQGESTDDLSFDRIVKSMAKQIPKIQASHGTDEVDFQVVTKNNKTYLKPVPK